MVDGFERLASYGKSVAKSIGYLKRAQEWLREIAKRLRFLVLMAYVIVIDSLIAGQPNRHAKHYKQ